MTRFCVLLFLISLTLLPAAPLAQAQDADEAEPLLEQLTRRFKTEPLHLGLLVQAVADYQFDRPEPGNGFSLAAARLSLRPGRESLVTRFALLVEGALTPEGTAYTRRVTLPAAACLVDPDCERAPGRLRLRGCRGRGRSCGLPARRGRWPGRRPGARWPRAARAPGPRC